MRFDRIYLSNVPDYTSILNAFLYFAPALRSGDDGQPGVIEHELLLNTLMWTSLEHYVFSSAYLRPSDYWMLGLTHQSGGARAPGPCGLPLPPPHAINLRSLSEARVRRPHGP